MQQNSFISFINFKTNYYKRDSIKSMLLYLHFYNFLSRLSLDICNEELLRSHELNWIIHLFSNVFLLIALEEKKKKKIQQPLNSKKLASLSHCWVSFFHFSFDVINPIVIIFLYTIILTYFSFYEAKFILSQSIFISFTLIFHFVF